MLIGAQVRTGGRLLGTFERAEAIRADDVQVFLQNPQGWMPPRYPPEELARFSSARTEHPRVARTYCHALYLINLATSDAALLERFRCALVANLAAVQAIGASGLVVHVGSHLGRGFDAAASQMVDELLAALDAASGSASSPGAVERRGAGCSVLIENPAGGGGSIGGQFEELADLVERADADDALGTCIATQHLWTFGVPFGSLAEADDVVAAIDATIGLGALRCVQLNDSKTPFGARVDRHSNIAEGSIGDRALACLVGHPCFAELAAILEVPGGGHGPRTEDVARARQVLRWGQRMWEEARQPAGAPVMTAEWQKRTIHEATEEASWWAAKEATEEASWWAAKEAAREAAKEEH
ncbi:MAG: deoxyribonuclease IV [Acidimicrobiales bacterium]